MSALALATFVSAFVLHSSSASSESTRACSSGQDCAQNDDSSLLHVATRKLHLEYSKAATSWYVQVGTKDASDCWTKNDISVQLLGAEKQSGWTGNLANQFPGNNFWKGDVGVYTVDCGSGSCPEPAEVDEICFKLDYSWYTITDGRWCPIDIRVFEKPSFTQIGTALQFPEFTKGTHQLCQKLSKPLVLPEPHSTAQLVNEVVYWADFGVARENAADISGDKRNWPLPQAIKHEGAYSLYEGWQDYTVNQGHEPKALFMLGDIGYAGGTDATLRDVVQAASSYSGNKVSPGMMFPAIGNHDVNGPSGCSTLDLWTCYYGNQVSAPGQSKQTPNFQYDEWRQSWLKHFPALQSGSIIIPKGAGAKWAAPLRYNVDLGSDSSVYFIIGLVAGAPRTKWGVGQPDVAVPVSDSLMKGKSSSNETGEQLECQFVRDSLEHGRSLSKTVFIYLTHAGPRPVTSMFSDCDEVYQQIDVWLFGHEHYLGLSAAPASTVTQEGRKGQPPVRFLLGNGGFDEGLSNVVSFVGMREYRDGDRVKLYFQAYDTCISATNCPWGTLIPLLQLPSCWTKCLDIPGGVSNRKATPSKEEGPTAKDVRTSSWLSISGFGIFLFWAV
ncbi:unnamed protein product [Polarella glacialis]|uniref:Purple acid phosphatase n=1 Tax=Polarella glacialis TaxID=89957 RepID=A0A813F6Z2_POLGL|nr:unnamed protein product [Polarella glacialis]